MRVVDKQEMREIETLVIQEYGFNESLIIENVGLRAADFIAEELLSRSDEDGNLVAQYQGEVTVLVGNGNNGADGMAIARHLSNRGHRVRAFLLFPDDTCSEELKRQAKMAHQFGVKISEVKDIEQLEAYFTQGTQEQYAVVDAILGLGFRLPLSNYLFDVINLANEHATLMISVDIPTGITADTGAISSAAIQADYTLAIGLPKTGHYISAGQSHTGEVVVVDGGFPLKALEGGDKALLTSEIVLDIYHQRNKFAHKNSFGHCLVLGGSPGLTGALLMASKAALKVGTGLATAATWKSSYLELVSRVIPEVMTGVIPLEKEEAESILKNLKRYDSIVIGPGMGMGEKTREAVLEVLAYFQGPVVVDADAIKMISFKEDASLFQQRKAPTILTPHIGEFAQFINKTVPEVLERPIEYLKEVVDGTNCTIVLKGACTYLGLPTGEVFINYFPNDGMASGGSGDVLAGIIGGFLAQNVPGDRKEVELFSDKTRFYDAVKLGLATHTLAGKYASKRFGVRPMTAGSIIDCLPEAFFELDHYRQQEN